MSRTMTVGQKQRIFTRNVGLLIGYAYSLGWELSFGEVKRTETEAAKNAAKGSGIANSLHLLALAVDFNLFIDGVYQTDSESHRRLGDFWKSLHELNRWGGDFLDKKGKPKPDGNHYSMEHNGVK